MEVESKYRSPGNDKIEKALQRLGAKKIHECSMEDIYYSHPGRDFAKTDESLRLRKMEGPSELTYKGPRLKTGNARAREEITLKLEDSLSAQRIVERLGFAEKIVIKKKRSSYLIDKLRVEVDDVDGLGEYVELELITEEPRRAESLIELARTELGLERLEKRTYLEMLLEKDGRS